MMRLAACLAITCMLQARAEDPKVAALAGEIRQKGWIGFSAADDSGQWDLFLMRPDGSEKQNLTETSGFSETGLRFSTDGRRLLYYRQPSSEAVDNNSYGTYELIVADTVTGEAKSFGNEFTWAAWGPDNRSIAALTPKGIVIVDVSAGKVTRSVPRHGIVQQLGWSDDGRFFVGTANGLGQFWNIGVIDIAKDKIITVSETERYNCTPDWIPGARRLIFARGIIPNDGGKAELWLASPDGGAPRMLYAEAGRHIYGGAASPDAKYLLFTRSVEDLGRVDHKKTTMSIIRATDTPMLGDDDASLAKRHPGAKPALMLDLGSGWEPSWTTVKTVPVKSIKP